MSNLSSSPAELCPLGQLLLKKEQLKKKQKPISEEKTSGYLQLKKNIKKEQN